MFELEFNIFWKSEPRLDVFRKLYAKFLAGKVDRFIYHLGEEYIIVPCDKNLNRPIKAILPKYNQFLRVHVDESQVWYTRFNPKCHIESQK